MTTDIDFADYFPNGVKVAGIGFVASGVTDILKLKSKTATGVTIVEIHGTGTVVYAESIWLKLYLDVSACTIAVPGSARLIVQLA
jgi:hypothetical protein